MILSSLLIPTFTSISCSKHSNPPTSHFQIPTASSQKSHIKILLLSNLASLAFALTLNSPLPSLAIPSLNSGTSLLPPTTPFSQSQDLQIGLENGKIRPCPSTNPGCVSTNPKSSSFAFPWEIPESSTENAIQKLQDAILKTQKNAKIQVIEDTADDRVLCFSTDHLQISSNTFATVCSSCLVQVHPNLHPCIDGKYLQAQVDGGFGRDVLEFLVKKDVVLYRSMSTKVTYVYPFTTALGDSKGQQERMKKILQELGWYEPSFEYMD